MVESQKTYEFASSPKELRWILRHAVSVLQACDILCARLTSPREANHLRDFAFSENVAWMLEHGHPGSKAVVFGHNIHMAKEPFRSFDSEQLVTSLGERLAQWYGHGYVAIGSAVGTGRVAGNGPGLVDIPAEDNPRRQSSLQSIDAALEEIGEQFFLLTMPRDLGWTKIPQTMRSHLQPTSDYTPALAFDAIAYVDGIVGSTALPNLANQ
ncbi:MAG: erythromycin esterase family protein [Pseudolabrys sp.]